MLQLGPPKEHLFAPHSLKKHVLRTGLMKEQLFAPHPLREHLFLSGLLREHLQWGKKVFSQPPIVQVLPLKKMREACNFHHRYTSTIRDKIRKKNPENHIVGFKNLFANYGVTKSMTKYFFAPLYIYRLLSGTLYSDQVP